ncbi:hypothetical protein [Brevundimonas aurantiaca]|nr:hypothetical protein [Brevundimonas aurantiaca]
MLRLYVLSAMVNMSGDASFRHLEGNEIQRVFRQLGFGDDLTARVLADLCRLRFIHTTSHTSPTFESNFILTRLGAYIVRFFLSDMMFLENMMMDTFIADDATWHQLKEQTESIYRERDIVKRLALRRQRVQAFFSYMSDRYTPLRDESARRGLPSVWCSHPLESAHNQLQLNLTRATRSAQRNYAPSAD